MKKVPLIVEDHALNNLLREYGFERIHQGKVRDTHQIDEDGDEFLLFASDRISIFDFVLPVLVPQKGEVLTALTHFWFSTILSEYDNHLIQSEAHPTANAAFDLKISRRDLPIERCLLVKNLKTQLWPWEMIYRHHIGGSVYGKYLKTGKAGGHDLPPNLPKWSKLEKPIFTPSTKEEVGHDINVDADFFFQQMENFGGEEKKVVEMLAEAYSKAYAYAEKRGILILDTKFEVASKTIVDEILTPDSSRFVLKEDWEKVMREGGELDFYDKQPVREWGSSVVTPFENERGLIVGINKLDPENEEHLTFVHSLKVPKKIISTTTERYLKIFEALTGFTLEKYQREKMGTDGIF